MGDAHPYRAALALVGALKAKWVLRLQQFMNHSPIKANGSFATHFIGKLGPVHFFPQVQKLQCTEHRFGPFGEGLNIAFLICNLTMATSFLYSSEWLWKSWLWELLKSYYSHQKQPPSWILLINFKTLNQVHMKSMWSLILKCPCVLITFLF